MGGFLKNNSEMRMVLKNIIHEKQLDKLNSTKQFFKFLHSRKTRN